MSKYAVVVVDVVNDFVDGVLGQPHALKTIQPIKTVLEAARKNNVPVFYTNDTHIAGEDKELEIWGEHAMAGTEGCQVYPEVAPVEGDYVIEKHTYSGFFKTTLNEKLVELGIDTLIVVGLYANICCRHTAVDGFFNGYNIVIPRDCMTSFAEEAYEGDLEYLVITTGAKIVNSDEVESLFA